MLQCFITNQICESRDIQDVGILVVGNKRDLLPDSRSVSERSREVAAFVRKHWKAGYIEVSSKYNWRVVAAFRFVKPYSDIKFIYLNAS